MVSGMECGRRRIVRSRSGPRQAARAACSSSQPAVARRASCSRQPWQPTQRSRSSWARRNAFRYRRCRGPRPAATMATLFPEDATQHASATQTQPPRRSQRCRVVGRAQWHGPAFRRRSRPDLVLSARFASKFPLRDQRKNRSLPRFSAAWAPARKPPFGAALERRR